eukprot:CAMPEP_0181221652 /NCGR_PEP_ID=MMETSP1096-20121128/29526_1 /TAXON_ID=156174 ORGANISM="Chrysochromulina ericina, Strain CCMP281" /NCGR_SAMPLE_ID=MMETSP1096 /ASSEMBLY_ACC=CAM_ASM_000453 /LENGTH=113 /DNA_ID=CAMNT_0023314319 /DNA_START=119 /DNA_END=461 /DNA_ORIENTATION=+
MAIPLHEAHMSGSAFGPEHPGCAANTYQKAPLPSQPASHFALSPTAKYFSSANRVGVQAQHSTASDVRWHKVGISGIALRQLDQGAVCICAGSAATHEYERDIGGDRSALDEV